MPPSKGGKAFCLGRERASKPVLTRGTLIQGSLFGNQSLMKTLLFALVPCLLLATFAFAAKKAPTKPEPAPAAQSHEESGKPHESCDHPKPDPSEVAAKTWPVVRGDKLKGAPSVALADLVGTPEKHVGKTVQVEAKVRKACQNVGCWMELASDDKSPGIRVRFKKGGFFVPLDSAGATAKVEGEVSISELTDAKAQHYESEGAIVPRGKDGKPREVLLVATGVELRR